VALGSNPGYSMDIFAGFHDREVSYSYLSVSGLEFLHWDEYSAATGRKNRRNMYVKECIKSETKLIIITIIIYYEGVSKSSRTESITK
jgi:hypothetical protein